MDIWVIYLGFTIWGVLAGLILGMWLFAHMDRSVIEEAEKLAREVY